jgi:predicted Zn-dependent peptidase
MVRASADAYEDLGTFTIRAGLDASRLKMAMQTILRELTKVTRSGVSAKELRHAKDHLAGALKLKLEDSSSLAEFFGRQEIFLRAVESEQAWLKRHERVSRADILRVAQDVLDTSRMSVAAIGPYRTDAALRNALGVLG